MSTEETVYRRHAIPPRRLKFNVTPAIPKYWNNNSFAQTSFFNALGMIVPSFERLGIVSILNYREAIQGHPVYTQVKGFVGQEASHSAVYIQYNKILQHHGYQVDRLEKKNIKAFYYLGLICTKKFLLSNTIAVEHLTAIWSKLILQHPTLLQNADKTFGAIWRWHAIEEIEHKAVAFDVFKAIGGGYFSRIFGMLTVSCSLTFFMSRNVWHMLGRDKLRWDWSTFKSLTQMYWGRQGLVRLAIKPYLAYFKPSFHPWQDDDHYLIEEWKQYLDQSGDTLEDIALRLGSITP